MCRFTASGHHLLGDGQNLTFLTLILIPRMPQNGSNNEVCEKWTLPSNFSTEKTYMCRFTASGHHLLGDGQNLTLLTPILTPRVPQNGQILKFVKGGRYYPICNVK